MKFRFFMDWPFLILVLLFVVTPVAVKVYAFYNVALYETPYNWMESQEKNMPSKFSDEFANGLSMQLPVEGTVARGQLAWDHGQEKNDEIQAQMTNPLPMTAEVIAKGKKEFTVFCSVCHGDLGDGKMKIRGKWFAPPPFHTKKIREDWTDGNIYHVITNGQVTMPSYAKQIPPDDRWAIIHYIRVLTKSQSASDAELQTLQAYE